MGHVPRISNYVYLAFMLNELTSLEVKAYGVVFFCSSQILKRGHQTDPKDLMSVIISAPVNPQISLT